MDGIKVGSDIYDCLNDGLGAPCTLQYTNMGEHFSILAGVSGFCKQNCIIAKDTKNYSNYWKAYYTQWRKNADDIQRNT